MDFDHVVVLLTQVPFAILVASYLLIRMERVLSQLAINEAHELEILRRLENYIVEHK